MPPAHALKNPIRGWRKLALNELTEGGAYVLIDQAMVGIFRFEGIIYGNNSHGKYLFRNILACGQTSYTLWQWRDVVHCCMPVTDLADDGASFLYHGRSPGELRAASEIKTHQTPETAAKRKSINGGNDV